MIAKFNRQINFFGKLFGDGACRVRRSETGKGVESYLPLFTKLEPDRKLLAHHLKRAGIKELKPSSLSIPISITPSMRRRWRGIADFVGESAQVDSWSKEEAKDGIYTSDVETWQATGELRADEFWFDYVADSGDSQMPQLQHRLPLHARFTFGDERWRTAAAQR